MPLRRRSARNGTDLVSGHSSRNRSTKNQQVARAFSKEAPDEGWPHPPGMRMGGCKLDAGCAAPSGAGIGLGGPPGLTPFAMELAPLTGLGPSLSVHRDGAMERKRNNSQFHSSSYESGNSKPRVWLGRASEGRWLRVAELDGPWRGLRNGAWPGAVWREWGEGEAWQACRCRLSERRRPGAQ